MLFTRLQTILVALNLSLVVNAANYLDLQLSSETSLEEYFDCEHTGGKVFSEGYANIENLTGDWQQVRSSQFNYEAAAFTSIVGDQQQRTVLTTKQSFLIDSPDYILRWNARSGLYKVQESFYVSVLVDPLDQGIDTASTLEPSDQTQEYVLLEVDNQDNVTKTYALSLKDFEGQRIRISFVATSTQGWMLLLDNFYLGEPSDVSYTCTNATPYHCALDASESIRINGSITSVGAQSSENLLELYVDHQLCSSLDLGSLPTGQQKDWEFTLPAQKEQTFQYSVRLNGIDVTSGTAVASTFSKRILTDHFTGTWCNNCPESMLEVISLEEKYGNELRAVNTHIGYNDLLTQEDYVEHFEVYAIPQFYFDHLPGPYTIGKDYVPPTLTQTPVAGINLIAQRDDTSQKVEFNVQAIFADDLDNSSDRYRIGLMLCGDFHDPANALLRQSNMQPLLQKGGILHYTKDGYIPTKVAWHFTIPYNTTYAFDGVENSLPKNLKAMNSNDFEMAVDIPDYLERYRKYTGTALEESALSEGYPITAIAMVLDTETSQVLNCAQVQLAVGQQQWIEADTNFEYPTVAAVGVVSPDSTEGSVRYFNLNGIEVRNPTTPGIYLKKTPTSTTKVVIR